MRSSMIATVFSLMIQAVQFAMPLCSAGLLIDIRKADVPARGRIRKEGRCNNSNWSIWSPLTYNSLFPAFDRLVILLLSFPFHSKKLESHKEDTRVSKSSWSCNCMVMSRNDVWTLTTGRGMAQPISNFWEREWEWKCRYPNSFPFFRNGNRVDLVG